MYASEPFVGIQIHRQYAEEVPSAEVLQLPCRTISAGEAAVILQIV